MSQTIVRLASGATVQVRQGVLRGAGPQGPIGPSGPAGPQGAQGQTGPAGSFTALRTDLVATGSVATAADQWYKPSMNVAPTQNDCLVLSSPWDGLNLQWKTSGNFLVVVTAQFEPQSGTGETGTSQGTRRLRFVDAAGNVLGNLQTKVAASPTGTTVIKLIDVVQPDASKLYHLEAQSADTGGGISLTNRSVTIIQIGAGPPGPAGPTGPVGSQGPQGSQGATGNAGTGYSTFNALIGGGDSSATPAGTTLTTADQALHYPGPLQVPASPYFFKLLANDIEKQLVAKYVSAADRTSKRGARNAGEVTYLGDTGVIQHREKNGTDQTIARVIQSASTPPTGANQAAPGVIWIQT